MLINALRHRDYRRFRLDGPRIYLRPPLHRDWRSWATLRRRSQGFLIPWEPLWLADSLSRRTYRRRLRHYAFEWRKGLGYGFLLFRRADRALLGSITLSDVRHGVTQSGSLGYWIGEPHARQGYMFEALGLIQQFAFDHVGLHRLEAACLPSNEASRRLLLKAGFSEEGFAREYLHINGRWQDHLLFGKLKSDPRLPKIEAELVFEPRQAQAR
jgi:ribosomal-protein-alanine N-acetyltransferase